MNDKFTSTKKARRLRERIEEIYRNKPCDLVVTYDGKLARRNDSGGLSYVVDDPDNYLDRIEREFQVAREKELKRFKRKIKAKLPIIVLSGVLAATAITGLVELKKEADYNTWRTEQILRDGGTTGFDKTDGIIYGIPKKGTDPSKYDKQHYKEYLKEQKSKGR